jgi:L-aminopeptidase/D-esterase-like protein
VSRRASLPGAAELFRPTGPTDEWFEKGVPAATNHHAATAPRRGTPRQKHTAKITVYVSDEELLALEHARLALRATHGLAVDRGRVVREAIAMVLADLEERGEESVLVRRLRHDTGK